MNAIIKWRSYSLRAKKILFFLDYNHKMKTKYDGRHGGPPESIHFLSGEENS